MALGLTLAVALALVLLFMLAQTTGNRELYERNYGRLLLVNAAVALVLAVVIGWIVVRLVSRLRRGKFGSRLLIKLAAIFALVGVMPGLLVYVVSYQFVSRSIESWFDVKVEGALDAGLGLGRTTLDTMAAEFGSKVRASAGQLADVSDTSAALALDRLREQLGADDVVLWSANGQAIASAGASRFLLVPDRPPPAMLKAVRTQRVVTQIDGFDDAGGRAAAASARIRALALVPQSTLGQLGDARVLQATQVLPASLVANAVAVTEAYREYQERALARQGLRRMYIGTLTLALFLSVFGAVLLAILLGNQLARPLLVLAEGVRQVAAGDLRPKTALETRDELGGLTRSFAQMTQQLADARGALESSMQQVTNARADLQTILDNLTAGVVVLDADGVVRSINPGATRVLRAPLAAWVGRPLREVPDISDFAASVLTRFHEFEAERDSRGLDHWQQAFELHAGDAAAGGGSVHLIARGAELPGGYRLLVLDDISEIVSAQRAQAWGEVARRLAHEIKNPLTPIQLSAERLAMKLQGHLGASEQALLDRSVRTIIDQVDAMKRLVNEFRDYARLPAADLRPLDLNHLVSEVLQLYGTETAHVPIVARLDPTCPPIAGDAHQLRQVLHNLLQNAQDASEGLPNAEVTISTHWSAASGRVRLVVRDAGPGFAEHILKRAFEPYVTTKARGTGLGLAVVKKIADEHAARVELSNRVVEGAVSGAQVSLSFAVAS